MRVISLGALMLPILLQTAVVIIGHELNLPYNFWLDSGLAPSLVGLIFLVRAFGPRAVPIGLLYVPLMMVLLALHSFGLVGLLYDAYL